MANQQWWPTLPDDVHPDVRKVLTMVMNYVDNSRQAFAALSAKQNTTATTTQTIVEQFQTAGTGNFFGPPSSTPGDVVTFADASGKQGSDANISLSSLATQVGVQEESYVYATDTGAANAYVIALTPVITAYVAGQEAVFVVGHTNTGASTLDAGGGAKNILKMSGGSLVALAAGDFTAGQLATVKYDGTQWQTPASGSMVYPGAGIPISTGTAWGTSLSETDGDLIAGVSGAWTKVTALPNGITATTQALDDNSTKVATTAYTDRSLFGKQYDGTPGTIADGTVPQFQSSPDKWEPVYVVRNLSGGVPGVPTAGQTLMFYGVPTGSPVAFAANFSGATGYIDPANGVNPAATTTLTVKKRVSSVVSTAGTISISTSGVFTFATTGGLAFSLGSGDAIYVLNQAIADTNMAGAFFTLPGYLGATAPTNIFASGPVSGPATSVVNNVVGWDSTNGTVTKDLGVAFSTTVLNNHTTVPDGAAVTAALGSLPNTSGVASLTPPPLVASLTWVNQSTSTAVDASNGIFFHQPFGATQFVAALLQNAPVSTPWTFTAGFIALASSVSFNTFGIVASDGTKMASFGFQWDGSKFRFTADNWNSANSWNGAASTGTIPLSFASFPILWLRVKDDGTNRIVYYSADGINFIQFLSVLRTSFVTATKLGIYSNAQSTTSDVYVTCVSWLVN